MDGDKRAARRRSREQGAPAVTCGEAFGWARTLTGLRQAGHRGLPKAGWPSTLAMAAYKLVRLPRLLGAAAWHPKTARTTRFKEKQPTHRAVAASAAHPNQKGTPLPRGRQAFQQPAGA